MIKHLLVKNKMFEVEAEVDAFLKENKIDIENHLTSIQAIVFDKEVFKDEAEAREWASDNCFYVRTVDDVKETFVIEQVSIEQFEKGSLKPIEIRRGVKVVIGVLSSTVASELYFSEKENGFKLAVDMQDIVLNDSPSMIEIARVVEGEHPTYGKIKITKSDLKSFVKNFNDKVTGTDLAVNEDHKKNEAFGWFKEVFLSQDETVCYGVVAWNAKGARALSEKEYRYFSPEFRFNYVHPHTKKEHGATLLGGALTNYPFLKMEAITELNDKTKIPTKGKTVDTIELSEHKKVVSEKDAKIIELSAKVTESENKTIALSNEVTNLKAEIEKKTKESANKKLFDDGKINAAQLVALNEGKSFLEVLALNEPMNTSGKGAGGKGSDSVIELSEDDKKVMKKFNLTEAEYREANNIK